MSIFKQDIGTVKAIYVGNKRVSDAYIGDIHIYSSNVLNTLKGQYLRFSPTNEQGTTVSVTKKGFTQDNSIFQPKLMYAIVDQTTINSPQELASITWSSYIFQTSIAIPYGHVMYMKNTIPTLNIDQNNYVQFKIKGLCDVTGSITSMIDGNSVCNYATFINLFRDCQDMTKCPKLVVSKATTDCFANIFRGCKNLYDFQIDFPGKSPQLATRGHSWYYDTKALLDPPKLYKTQNGYIIDKPMPKIVTSSANIAWVDPRFVYSQVYQTNIFQPEPSYYPNPRWHFQQSYKGKKGDIELSIKYEYVYWSKNQYDNHPGGDYLQKSRHTYQIKQCSITRQSGTKYLYNDGLGGSEEVNIKLIQTKTDQINYGDQHLYQFNTILYELGLMGSHSKTFFAQTGIVYMLDIQGNAIQGYKDCRKIIKEYQQKFKNIFQEVYDGYQYNASYNYSPQTQDQLLNIGMRYDLPAISVKKICHYGLYPYSYSDDDEYIYYHNYYAQDKEQASSEWSDGTLGITRDTNIMYTIGDDVIYNNIQSEQLFFDNTNQIVVDGYVLQRPNSTFVHPQTGQTYEGGTYHQSVWSNYPIGPYNLRVNFKQNQCVWHYDEGREKKRRTIQQFQDDIVTQIQYNSSNHIYDNSGLFHLNKTKPLMYNLEIFPQQYLQAIVDDPTNYKQVKLIHPLPSEQN